MRKINKITISFLLFIIIAVSTGIDCVAQNVSISDEKGAPLADKAVLDIYSTSRGILLPRVVLQSAEIPVSGVKPQGLLLWNTTESDEYSVGFHFWDGIEWVLIGQDEYTPSAVTHYIQDALTAIDADVILDEELYESNLKIAELISILSEMSEIVGNPAQIVAEDRATRLGAGLDLESGEFIVPNITYYTTGATSIYESTLLLDENLFKDIKALATSVVANSEAISNLNGDDLDLSAIDARVSVNENSIVDLQNELSNLDQAVDHVTNSVTELDNRTTLVENSLSNNHQDLEMLETLVNKNTIGIDAIETTIVSLQEQDVVLGAAISNNTSDITTLSNSVTALDVRVTDNTIEITNLSKSIHDFDEELSNTNASIEILSTDVTKLSVRVGSNETTIGEQAKDIQNNSDRISEIENNGSGPDLSEEVAQNTSDISDLENRVSSVENSTDISDLSAEVEANTKNISSNTSTINAVSVRVDENEQDIAAIELSVQENSNRITVIEGLELAPDLTAEVIKNTGDIAAIRSDVDDLDLRVSSNEVNIATNYSDLTERLEELENNPSDLSEQVEINTVDIADLKKKDEELSKNISENSKSIELIGLDLNSISKNVDDVQDDLESGLENLEDDIRKNYDRISDNEDKIEELEKNSELAFGATGIVESEKGIVANMNKEVLGFEKITIGSEVEESTSAALEINSTTQGFLPPRMELDEIKGISNPAEGLMVYCSTLKKPLYYDGVKWLDFMGQELEYNVGDFVGGGIVYKIESGILLIVATFDDDTPDSYDESVADAINFVSGQYDDWQLPSLADLELIYSLTKDLSLSGISFSYESYWTTDSNTTDKRIVLLTDGSSDERSEQASCWSKYVRTMNINY